MSDDHTSATSTSTASSGGLPMVIIPPELKEKEPELIALIMQSESMNNEERQYWIDILPVMTSDQITQLRQILDNERSQLAAIDEKYAKEIDAMNPADIVQTTKERKERQQERSSKEEATRSSEADAAEKLLKEME